MTRGCRSRRPPRAAAAALLLLAAGVAAAAPYKSDPGPHRVEVQLGEWADTARDGRVVRWKLYLPEAGDEAVPAPVVIWSHGAGGSRDGAEYLGRHLASWGYATFHLQHAGSDVVVLRQHGVQGMLREVRSPQVSIDRFGDVPFAVQRIAAMAQGDLAGRLDAERIGISGHSFGAITTLVAVGQSMPQVGRRFAVPELRGAFAMSPSKPRGRSLGEAFAAMSAPIFHLTGTDDGSPLGDQTVETRLAPFEAIDGVEQWLLVLDDGVHSTFSGRPVREPGKARDELGRHHEIVRMAAVAFWDLVLRGDAAAAAWLREGGLAAELSAEDGTVRHRPAGE